MFDSFGLVARFLCYSTYLFDYVFEDMALESCEGGELFDQITRVSSWQNSSVSLWESL